MGFDCSNRPHNFLLNFKVASWPFGSLVNLIFCFWGTRGGDRRDGRHCGGSVQRSRDVEQGQSSQRARFWTGGPLLCWLWGQWGAAQRQPPPHEVMGKILIWHEALADFKTTGNFSPSNFWTYSHSKTNSVMSGNVGSSDFSSSLFNIQHSSISWSY